LKSFKQIPNHRRFPRSHDTQKHLDDFARLIETHYETFDTEGRGLLPLTKVYWPAD
jgi:hypothetical protein